MASEQQTATRSKLEREAYYPITGVDETKGIPPFLTISGVEYENQYDEYNKCLSSLPAFPSWEEVSNMEMKNKPTEEQFKQTQLELQFETSICSWKGNFLNLFNKGKYKNVIYSDNDNTTVENILDSLKQLIDTIKYL